MNKYVPFKSTYQRVNQVESVAFWLASVAAFLIFSNWYISLYEANNIEIFGFDLKMLQEPLKVASYTLVTFFFLFELLAKVLFSEAERIKREDLVDNSFGTQFSDEKSFQYYNNDNIDYGILKFALNTYESSFHTVTAPYIP